MSKSEKIKLNFGENSGQVNFDDIDAFSEWFQNEKKAWQWLGKSATNNQHVGKFWQHINTQWQQIEKNSNNYKANLANNPDTRLNTFIETIQTAYGQNRLIRSDSPRGSFIIEISESDPVVAASAGAFFVGLGIAHNDPKALEGAFRALQFDRGIESNIDAERAALEALRTKWDAEYTALSEKFSQVEQANEILHSEIKEAKKTQGSEFSEFLNKADESKTAIEQTYREHMALKAPVEYWAKKAGEHNRKAVRLGKVAGWSGAIVAALLIAATWILLVGVDNPDYWRLAIVGLFAALGIWLVRIITRLFLSNLHQASDAEERVTMVETFLSLMSEGHISRDEDRHLVLQTLFRSTQTGLVRDEGSPPTVIDISNKLFRDRS